MGILELDVFADTGNEEALTFVDPYDIVNIPEG